MALIENIQRENLNPIDEALAYRRLADEFQLRQEDIASAVGKGGPRAPRADELFSWFRQWVSVSVFQSVETR
jgi:ParB-like chromosome segregation protein Spo0J